MRRIWLYSLLCLLTSSTVAFASTRSPSAWRTSTRYARGSYDKRVVKRSQRTKATSTTKSTKAAPTATAAAAGGDPVLFGDQSVESGSDWNSSGLAEAFQFSNPAAATTASISVYVDSASKATKLYAGVYADSNGHPGSLVASGSISSPKVASWNDVTVPSASVSAGKSYWVAVLGTGGTFRFRDRSSGTCTSENSSRSSLTSLPSTWKSGPEYHTCPISAYVNGYLAAPAPPAATTMPAISGSTAQGQNVATSNGVWTGSPSSYAYQWRRCDRSGNNCANVSGANSRTYTLASGDVGATMRAVVTATNAGGSASASSPASATVTAPAPVAPSNTALPTISGTATQGQTLTAGNGSWSGSPASFAYQWRGCDSSGNSCTNISGATSSTYKLAGTEIGDTVQVIVRATNAGGSTPATSAQTSVVAAAPPAPPVASFTFSPASPTPGQAVHFNAGASSCSATPCTYTWADNPPSGGSWSLGSGQPLDFTFNTVGTKYVTLTVTDAQNLTDTVEHDVAVGTAAVAPPTNTSLPSISGTPQQGNTLTESDGTWSGGPTSYSFQWQRCDSSGANCSSVSGATGKTYPLAAGDVGRTVRGVATAANSGGSSSATTAQTAVVTAAITAAPSNGTPPAISGTATQGQSLSTSNGSWSGSPTSYTYQWRQCDASGSNCTNIAAGTSSSYMLAAGDVGHTARVVVTATNAAGSTPATTAQTNAVASSGGSGGGTGACDVNATTSNFASQVSGATAGQTICLASGNYGTWNGTNKAITVTAASGASPQMQVNFGSSANGFTLSGMTGMGGAISAGATNVTIKNSTFTRTIDIEGATHNVVLDHNTHNWMVGPSTGGPNAKIFVDVSGTLAAPALTVENSDIENGDLDGVHVGGGSGLAVLNNTFKNLCDMNANHTDNIQFEGGTQIRIAGNYVYESQSCATQGITSYDGGTTGLIIEDNVVDVPRDWGIELYSDQNSIVRHNTVVYHTKSYSEFNTGCGDIDVDRKSQDPAGTGTHVYDNNATVSLANGSTGTADHNTDPSAVSYVGGAPGPSLVFSNLFLTATSAGHNAASDGLDTGIRHSVS